MIMLQDTIKFNQKPVINLGIAYKYLISVIIATATKSALLIVYSS